MAWIESHQDLERHPKLLDLALKAQTDKFGALGKLHCLWYWCLSYAIDGDLRKFSPDAITLACSIPLDVLLECNFVDAKPYLRIHDWWDYAGKFIKIKFKNYPKKWMRIEKLYQRDIRVTPRGTPRQLTNHTNLTDLTIPYTEFPKWWEQYRGRLPGIKEFSDDRKAAFGSLWKKNPDASYWQGVIQKLAASDFACGENKTGWKATVDFFLRKSTHIKISEGHYDNRVGTQKDNIPTWMQTNKTT